MPYCRFWTSPLLNQALTHTFVLRGHKFDIREAYLRALPWFVGFLLVGGRLGLYLGIGIPTPNETEPQVFMLNPN